MSAAYAANIALVVTFIIVLIVLVIIIVRQKRPCPPPPPPPPDDDDCGCHESSILITCDPPVLEPPKAAVRLDDVHDPNSISMIMKVTRDEVVRPNFGYFKPLTVDSSFEHHQLQINAATCDPRGNLYIHITNPGISGVYRLDRMLANQSEDASAWQCLVGTGELEDSESYSRSLTPHAPSKSYNSPPCAEGSVGYLYNLKGLLDVSKITTIIGLSLGGPNDDQLALVTLSGVYDVLGNKMIDDYIYRNGRYAITRDGQLHRDGVMLILPPGITIDLNQPLQVVDLAKTHSGVRYAYLCSHMGTRGLVIARDAGPVFIPFEATAFALVETALFCLDYDGGLYRRPLSEEKFDKIADTSNAILVGGGEMAYVVTV